MITSYSIYGIGILPNGYWMISSKGRILYHNESSSKELFKALLDNPTSTAVTGSYHAPNRINEVI